MKETIRRKVIKTYLRKPLDTETLEANLYKEGNLMVPGTTQKFYPRKDMRGRVLTGIDEDSARIRAISDKKLQKQEIERIKALRLKLEYELNEDLTPESDYWKAVCGDLENHNDSGGFHLEDKDNVFDMSKPEHVVSFMWLMETGLIAESIEELRSGRKNPSIVKFYVHDEEEESSTTFERKKRSNSARAILEKLSFEEQRRIARLLGIADTNADPKTVYNALDSYLSTPKYELGKDPIESFLTYTELPKDLVYVKNLVEDLIEYNIVRVHGGVVKEGEVHWAKSKEEFENMLLDTKYTDERDNFEEKLKQKKTINSI